MKKIIIILALFVLGCSMGPNRESYQSMMNEKVESPFFYVPPLNQKDFEERTWVVLAESKSKIWYYDPYSLFEDEDGILTYDAYIAPREKNTLPPFNPTIVGPFRQKLDCFSNYQWSETFYTQNIVVQGPLVGDVRPINGSGWVKIAPKTAMAYVRTRLCGRKFIDDHNANYFLFQEGLLPVPPAQQAVVDQAIPKANQQVAQATDRSTPIFYDVINNEVTVTDTTRDIRQLRLSSYWLDKDFSKQADYLFTANCQTNTYTITPPLVREKPGGASGTVGLKDTLAAVAFNRACANHGTYMKIASRGTK